MNRVVPSCCSADIPLFVVFLCFCASIGSVAFGFQRLMSPTVLENPGLAAHVSPQHTAILDAATHLAEHKRMEETAVALADRMNRELSPARTQQAASTPQKIVVAARKPDRAARPRVNRMPNNLSWMAWGFAPPRSSYRW
jgi:hypothetical protein